MEKLPLMSKSGCDRCKSRRKKCDEQKPICTDCRRLKFNCTWAGGKTKPNVQPVQIRIPNATGTEDVQDLIICRVLPSRDISKPSRVFQTQTQLTLTLSYPQLFSMGVARWWHNDETEISTTMKFALQSADVSNALSAISGNIMLNVTGNPAFTGAADQYYQAAVRVMRRNIAQGLTGSDMICPYFAMGILGFYELCTLGNVDNASYHFIAAIQMWNDVLQAFRFNQAVIRILRFTCANHLFNFAASAVFMSMATLNRLMRSIDWNSMMSVFVPPLLTEPMGCHLLAFYGLPLEIYRLILEVCNASRIAKTDGEEENENNSKPSRIDHWHREIAALEDNQISFYARVPTPIQHLGLAASSLYLCCLRIWIAKYTNPTTTCSSTGLIRRLVKHGQALLRQCIVPGRLDFDLVWPMMIMTCAARRDDEVDAMEELSKSFWIHEGTTRLWRLTVKSVRSMRSSPPCGSDDDDDDDNINTGDCQGCHDGLDLLLLPNGIQ